MHYPKKCLATFQWSVEFYVCSSRRYAERITTCPFVDVKSILESIYMITNSPTAPCNPARPVQRSHHASFPAR